MNATTRAIVLAFAAATSLHAQHASAVTPPDIDAFNNSFASATRAMDNVATLALWDDDGVSLLPATKPIVGKPAIAKFLTAVMASLSGAHMTSFEIACYDAHVSGDWASEWCTEHQVVNLGPGKAPFDGYGKMLLVLHRGPGGTWRIHEEMWNQALAPDAPAR